MASANTRVVLDLVRDTETIIDLTPYFQGRVGDSQSSLPMAIQYDGRAKNLTGYDVLFEGKDPNGDAKRVYGTADESGHGDNWSMGRITFKFPTGVFTTAGVWSSACFKIITANSDPDMAQEIISTINVNLNVFEAAVDMSIAKGSYESRMETIIENFSRYVASQKDLVTKLPTDLQVALTASSQLKSMVDQYLSLFNQKGVPTTNDLTTMAGTTLSQARTYTDNKISSLTATSSDFNSCTGSGMDYVMNANSTSGPNTLAGVVSVHGNSTRLYQLFVDSNNDAWTRYRNGTTWTSWNHVTMFY